MKKGEVLLCIISFIFCIMLLGNTAFAQDIGNDIINNDKQVEENNKEDLEKENRKKEIIKMIDECLDEIRSKLMDIENKEAKVKKQKEFENYLYVNLDLMENIRKVFETIRNNKIYNSIPAQLGKENKKFKYKRV